MSWGEILLVSVIELVSGAINSSLKRMGYEELDAKGIHNIIIWTVGGILLALLIGFTFYNEWQWRH
jgi:hypothetical protein